VKLRSARVVCRLNSSVAARVTYCDVVIRGGEIFDGGGGPSFRGDVAIDGDRILQVGELGAFRGRDEVEATGLAVVPGFINVLSWAVESLIEDGRAQSDVRQGVTLEIFGEGSSMGPLNEDMKEELVAEQSEITYDVEWTTLGEYLEWVVGRGVSPNVGSLVGAATVRMHELGYENRAPTADELERMCDLVRAAMREGALGVGSALIYVPGCFAQTAELTELAKAGATYDCVFTCHLRSEGKRLLEAVEEVVKIAREAGTRAEIYHLKAAGRENWRFFEAAIERVERARADGLELTADMYPYTAGATGLDVTMPPWVQEGGHEAWRERLRDPMTRERVAREMTMPTDEWENLYLAAGPENIVLLSFRTERLRPLIGRTLAAVAAERGISPPEAAMQLVVEDESRVGAAFFQMSEQNVRRGLALPWVSICSDANAPAREGVFLRSNPHPRAYGAFARFLGRYVRDVGVVPFEEAVRRMTSLPAEVFRIRDRGSLATGSFADVVVLDATEIRDHATFEHPHRYATGVRHVLVNGTPVVRDGEHTGARPGRIVRGPGWAGPRQRGVGDIQIRL
jgi:N-acyl-D-amino-acid deacylase